MIRINLAKSSNFMNAGGGEGQLDLFKKDIDLKINWSHLKKIPVIFIFPSAFIAYEKFNSFLLEESLKKIVANVNKVEQELKKFGDISSVVQELIKEKKEMNEKIKVIREISKRRTLKTDILLEIQEKIPEDVWLRKILFEKEKILIDGYSKEISLVQEMMDRLRTVKLIESIVNKDIKMSDRDKTDESRGFGLELKLRK